MRNGEIASLRWEDFDGDCIRLRVENAKNGTARLLPLEGELVQPIEWRKAARQVKGNGKGSMSALIFHRTGERIREFRNRMSPRRSSSAVPRLEKKCLPEHGCGWCSESYGDAAFGPRLPIAEIGSRVKSVG
jgi:integrase